jgi:hypothetical protein
MDDPGAIAIGAPGNAFAKYKADQPVLYTSGVRRQCANPITTKHIPPLNAYHCRTGQDLFFELIWALFWHFPGSVMRQRTGLLLAALALLISFTASAHTRMERSMPAADSLVSVSPPRITLWFSERLEPAFSKVRVLDAADQPVDKDDTQVSEDDGKQITVSVPALAPGKYRVHWRVLSVDSHVNEGDFTFDVQP